MKTNLSWRKKEAWKLKSIHLVQCSLKLLLSAMASAGTVIRDGDVVVLQRYNYLRTHKIDTKCGARQPRVQLAKETVDLSAVLGHPYGSTFKMVRAGKVWALERTEEKVDFEEKVLNQTDGGEDNREIVDENRCRKSTFTQNTF